MDNRNCAECSASPDCYQPHIFTQLFHCLVVIGSGLTALKGIRHFHSSFRTGQPLKEARRHLKIAFLQPKSHQPQGLLRVRRFSNRAKNHCPSREFYRQTWALPLQGSGRCPSISRGFAKRVQQHPQIRNESCNENDQQDPCRSSVVFVSVHLRDRTVSVMHKGAISGVVDSLSYAGSQGSEKELREYHRGRWC